MGVLLILPPTDSAIKRVVGTTGPPLGLAYPTSMVREEHDVKIIDGIAEDLTLSHCLLRHRVRLSENAGLHRKGYNPRAVV